MSLRGRVEEPDSRLAGWAERRPLESDEYRARARLAVISWGGPVGPPTPAQRSSMTERSLDGAQLELTQPGWNESSSTASSTFEPVFGAGAREGVGVQSPSSEGMDPHELASHEIAVGRSVFIDTKSCTTHGQSRQDTQQEEPC